MAGARSVECKCIIGSFTCGYCLSKAVMKPWFYTLSDGSAIAVIPEQTNKETKKYDNE